MPDFVTRLAVGDMLERRVRCELEARGWTVDMWGQGVLSEPIRDALWRSNSRLRYLPDLIAARAAATSPPSTAKIGCVAPPQAAMPSSVTA